MEEKDFDSVDRSKTVFQIRAEAYVERVSRIYGNIMPFLKHALRDVIRTLDWTTKAHAWVVIIRDLKNSQKPFTKLHSTL
jgi:hypothetical protein